MDDLHVLAERLCRASDRHVDADGGIEWPDALAADEWCFTPELLSLHGMPEYEALSEPARRRLSFHEAVNFFSLNLHGERMLVAGLASRATAPEWRELASYLAYFRADEERHMASFGEFCRRYAGGMHPARSLAMPRAYASGEADLLFFAKVLVFEEIVDVYNQRMAADARLSPLVREINRRHHLDERRHLAFGRALVRTLHARRAPSWSPAVVRRVRTTLERHVTACLHDYFSVDVYRAAGFGDPYWLRERAITHPGSQARLRPLAERCRRALPALLDEAT